MTSQTTSPGEHSPEAALTAVGLDTPSAGPDAAARGHLVVAVVSLVVAALLGFVVALQLVAPDFLGGIAFLSYGRLRPMAMHALVYGWLTIGFIGALYFIVPRLTGTPLWNERLASAALGLAVVGYGGGLVGIGIGQSQGRELTEAPLWAAVIVLGALVTTAIVVTRTVGAATGAPLGPAHWYAVAAVWWLVLVHIAGNVPGVAGVNAALQAAFYKAGLSGLWVGAAGLAVVYYLIPAVTGRAAPVATRVGWIGFWSLAFVWPWTAAGQLVYGPGPDWLATLGVVFSMGLVVVVLAILVDLVTAMRGHWGEVSEAGVIRFALAGTVLFALVPIDGLVRGLRSSAAVVGLTQWGPASDHLLFHGVASLWLFAFVYHAAPRLLQGRLRSRALGSWHLRLSLLGLGTALFGLWFAALQAGFTWVSGANAAAFASVGAGFRNSVVPLEAMYAVTAVGLGLFLLAQLALAVNLILPGGAAAVTDAGSDGDAAAADPADSTPADEQSAELRPEEAAPPVALGSLVRRAVLLFLAGLVGVWLLPSLEADHHDGTLLADTVRIYPGDSLEASGRRIYLEEGCWYCHTQNVRPIVADVGLGGVSQPGDYVHENPSLLGVQRIGPDLMHAGSRENTRSVGWLIDHLRDPRAQRGWSIMPSYDWLSDDRMLALATYVASLD